jgi:hypothetical protein
MIMLYICFGLFALAILSPFIFPNKKVSKHGKDHE